MKQEKVKVVIEKIGRIWIQAKDVRYNGKTVKIQINENFTKEYAKENIGKELEFDCKIEFKEKYVGGYEVIMYPINLEKVNEAKKIREYSELKNKIVHSIEKWTKEKAENGVFYVSKFVRENIEKLKEEDKKEVKDLIKKYETKVENNTFYYVEDFADYEDVEILQVGKIVKHKISGQYGIVIKSSKAYRVSQADVEDGFHAWGTKYATETLCKVLDETDVRVQAMIKEEAKKIEEVVESKNETKEFLQAFESEFSIENKIEFSEDEKQFLMKNSKIKLSGEEIWVIEKNNGFGKAIIVEKSYIWVIINNTGDGDNWDINFLISQTGEGYGYKLEKTNKRLDMLDKFKTLNKK